MAVFNSLGSNYKLSFVIRNLLPTSSKNLTNRVTEMLDEQYMGRTILTYKGRHALELALKMTHLPGGSKVGINGFTCYVVYEAVVKAGYHPVFIDVAKDDLNFGLSELKNAEKYNKGLQAIIVQNSLGLPCDMPSIEKYCRQQDIKIIEDLAHSLGAHYEDGSEAGTTGDFTMLSFSQDKPLDVVAGGAVIDRTAKAQPGKQLPRAFFYQRFVNYLYPLLSWLIRATYPVGLGRYLHAGLKKMHLLATPMSDNVKKPYRMTGKAKGLLVARWLKREEEVTHRRKVADVYKKLLPAGVLYLQAERGLPSYLRFPIKVSNRAGLVKHLKASGIYIGDTWYDAPIAPARYLARTSYQQGMCPEAEKLCAEIVNLPTHINVTEQDAKRIVGKVNSWLLKQKR
jgi:dTDP-4-amino-4,6-dideoxygalactose transaminase